MIDLPFRAVCRPSGAPLRCLAVALLLPALFLAATADVPAPSYSAAPSPTLPPQTMHDTLPTAAALLAAWHSIDSLVAAGFPSAALASTEVLLSTAREQNLADHLVKALVYRNKLRMEIAEYTLPDAISDFESELAHAHGPLQDILRSMLAECYMDFLHANRWKMADRTGPTEPDSPDIDTWTTAQLAAKVRTILWESVRSDDNRSIPLSDFHLLLQDAERKTAHLRPTLYDFLMDRALFLLQENRFLLFPSDDAPAFLRVDSLLFAPADRFVDWKIPSSPGGADGYATILTLYQMWLTFHRQDTAIQSDIDLHRLFFASEVSASGQQDRSLLLALQALAEQTGRHPAAAEILFRLGDQYARMAEQFVPLPPELDSLPPDPTKWYNRTARDVFRNGMVHFPNSQFFDLSAQRIRKLEAASFTLTVPAGTAPDQPFLAGLQYRNLQGLQIRVVRLDHRQYTAWERMLVDPDSLSQAIAALDGYATIQEWRISLPDDGDLHRHQSEFAMPALDCGYYMMVALGISSQGNPSSAEPQALAAFQVSRWGAFHQTDLNGPSTLVVFDRMSGKPQAGVTVTLWQRPQLEWPRRASTQLNRLEEKVTDRNGMVLLGNHEEGYRSYEVSLAKGKDTFHIQHAFHEHARPAVSERTRQSVQFFLDRAIYRPGQPVHFKILCMAHDASRKPSLLTGKSVTVSLYDANGKTVDKISLRTNSFGSAQGSFVLPATMRTGSVHLGSNLVVQRFPFQVEEYKRPRFEISLQPEARPRVVGDSVRIRLQAAALSGANLPDATVQWSVERTARFPFVPDWMRSYVKVRYQSSSTTIAAGTGTTGPDGFYDLSFPADPDARFHSADQPVYHYVVSVVVTDLTGESRQAESRISVGYRPMDLRLSVNGRAPEQGVWPSAQGFRLDVSAANLNGDPVAASGNVRLERLHTPEHPLLTRNWPVPDRRTMDEAFFVRNFPHLPWAFEDQPEQWKVEKLVYEGDFNRSADGQAFFSHHPDLPDGWYKATITATAPGGEQIEHIQFFQVFLPAGKPVPIHAILSYELMPGKAGPQTFLPGQSAAVRLASFGKSTVPVWLEIVRPNQAVERKWIEVKGAWTEFIPIRESDRGNVHCRVSFAGKGFAWTVSRQFTVPWDNKELNLQVQSFRDKTLPGSEAEWILTVKGQAGAAVTAELAATMYDAALDAFASNQWRLSPWPTYRSALQCHPQGFEFNDRQGLTRTGWQEETGYLFDGPPVQRYVSLNWFDWERGRRHAFRLFNADGLDAVPMVGMKAGNNAPAKEREQTADASTPAAEQTWPEPMHVAPVVRSDFGETVFFFPQLQTDSAGDIRIRFRNKDALTRWKILLLAHTESLETAQLEKSLQTQLPLMVIPSPPRFFREFDRMVFPAKVVNLSDVPVAGRVRLDLANGLTGAALSFEDLSGEDREKFFELLPGAAVGITWDLNIPDASTVALLEHTVLAETETHQDAERGLTPVLSNLELVTETLPLPVRESDTKSFRFHSLIQDTSSTLRHQGLVVEFTSHPVWLALQALPFSMLQTDDSNANLFTRYYANATASMLVRQFPTVRKVLQIWRDFPDAAPTGQLSNHPDLKSALLAETPWVWDARSEEQQLRDLAILLDEQTVAQQTEGLLASLLGRQAASGAWPWFPGGPDSWVVTAEILEGFGQLMRRGVLDSESRESLAQMVAKAVAYGDAALLDRYERLEKSVREGRSRFEDDHLDARVIHHLYVRSFFLPGNGKVDRAPTDRTPMIPLEGKSGVAWKYYLEQVRRYWLGKGLYREGMAALVLHRSGDADGAGRIVQSLRDRAIRDPEWGMYWKISAGWSWFQSPVELQAMLMELFQEVAQDERAAYEMMVWLLKQKQTHRWENSKATIHAVDAILTAGGEPALMGRPVELTIGGEKPSLTAIRHNEGLRTQSFGSVTAGSGYFSYRIPGPDIHADMGLVQVSNPNPTLAWGALYWQYFEELNRIDAFDDTPLRLQKSLFRVIPSDSGEVLVPLLAGDSLSVGEKVQVRLVIRSDRDMEFVHLKDMRAAAFEPLQTRSAYHWSGGLGWYESIRDTANNFYFDRLPKGTHVLSYPLRVTFRGNFSNGIARIQSMYAPEFSSHSGGMEIRVQ